MVILETSEHDTARQRKVFDVAVIGGGPAGNVAARLLSIKGYSVVVLDARKSLGEKLCTGIIGNESLERFPQGRQDILFEARSATIVAPSGKVYKVFKPQPQAYIIDRVSFISRLAQIAKDAGSTYRLGERATHMEFNANGVTVGTLAHDSPHSIEAKVLIIASGFASPLLRQAGFEDGCAGSHMVGCQAEVAAEGVGETEVYLGDNISPGSFGWLVPLSGTRALAGIVSRRELNGHMSGFLSLLRERGKTSYVIREPQQWGIPLRPITRTYGDRVVVAGDAAGLAKPTTGGGIYYAQLSGEIAADTIHKAFKQGDFSAQQLKEYETRWKALFGKELRMGYYARLLYETLEDEQKELLLERFLSPENIDGFLSSEAFSFDWHAAIIKKVVLHQDLGTLLKTFGPAVAPFVNKLLNPNSN